MRITTAKVDKTKYQRFYALPIGLDSRIAEIERERNEYILKGLELYDTVAEFKAAHAGLADPLHSDIPSAAVIGFVDLKENGLGNNRRIGIPFEDAASDKEFMGQYLATTSTPTFSLTGGAHA